MPRRAGGIALGALVGLLALAMVAPFLYMLTVALADPTTLTAALTTLPFDRFFLNSAIVSLAVVTGQVLTSTMAGYAFARLRFPGRDGVFLGYLAVLVVPGIVLLVPRFLMINALGWVDTYQGLVSTELVSVAGIFLMRQFFRTIPRDLEDAARLEGAGEWTIFRRLALPLAQPAVAALVVLGLVDQWKSFFWPLVATRSTDMRVLEVGLSTFHGLYAGHWPYQMAAAAAALAPMVLLYLVVEPLVLRGVELSQPT
jgi:multiple sugar transport system permease protein